MNPAVKSFLAKASAKRRARRHPFAGSGEKLEDIGATECVVTMTNGDPQMGQGPALNQKRFKREVETLTVYATNADTGKVDERVKVEFNWEGYEYHPSNVLGASLPTVHLSPTATGYPSSPLPPVLINTLAGAGTISLTPPNSDEGAPAGGQASLDLHIPGPEIPDWWSPASTTTPALLSPPTSSLSVPFLFLLHPMAC